MGKGKGSRMVVWAAALAAMAAASGCTNRNSPDEFRVVARAPLEVPPDFNLRPPQPGSPRPQELARDNRAQTSVFGASGGGALIDPRSSAKQTPGEGALLAMAGADQNTPDIRALVDRENPGVVVGSPSLLDKLMFWKDDQKPEAVLPGGNAPRINRSASSDGQPKP
jgi:Protein of unknown function (DUF3035)